MAIQRPLKEGSVRTYQQKVALNYLDILASEMDADLDTIYAAWNGGVGTGDIQDGAVTLAKLATDAKLWTDTGSVLTPVPAARPVAIPGHATTGAAVIAGARTVKGRLVTNPTADAAFLMCNRDLTAVDDATKPAWHATLHVASDFFAVARAAAGAGVAATNLLQIDSAGAATLVGRLAPRAYGGGLTMAANQTIAQGQTAELNFDTALFASNLNTPQFHQLIADRDGLVLLAVIVNFAAAVSGLGAGIEIQQWNNGTWGRTAAVATTSQVSLATTGMAPCWSANYRAFRVTLTNATTGAVQVNGSFFMQYLGGF